MSSCRARWLQLWWLRGPARIETQRVGTLCRDRLARPLQSIESSFSVGQRERERAAGAARRALEPVTEERRRRTDLGLQRERRKASETGPAMLGQPERYRSMNEEQDGPRREATGHGRSSTTRLESRVGSRSLDSLFQRSLSLNDGHAQGGGERHGRGEIQTKNSPRRPPDEPPDKRSSTRAIYL